MKIKRARMINGKIPQIIGPKNSYMLKTLSIKYGPSCSFWLLILCTSRVKHHTPSRLLCICVAPKSSTMFCFVFFSLFRLEMEREKHDWTHT